MHYKIDLTIFGTCAPYPRLIYWIASSISQGKKDDMSPKSGPWSYIILWSNSPLRVRICQLIVGFMTTCSKIEVRDHTTVIFYGLLVIHNFFARICQPIFGFTTICSIFEARDHSTVEDFLSSDDVSYILLFIVHWSYNNEREQIMSQLEDGRTTISAILIHVSRY